MSVLIKGMEMPKNCKECMFADFEDVDFDYVLYCTANKKYADLDMYDHPMGWNCPLVEIPTPHSDLVDRDALIAEYDRQHKGPAGGARRIMEQAKTVIEAEGVTE